MGLLSVKRVMKRTRFSDDSLKPKAFARNADATGVPCEGTEPSLSRGVLSVLGRAARHDVNGWVL